MPNLLLPFPFRKRLRSRRRRRRSKPHQGLKRDTTHTRFRERTVPVPSGTNPIQIGSYSIEQGDLGSQDWKDLNSSNMRMPTWMTFRKAESCVDEIHPGPPYLSGGPFRKISIEYAMPDSNGLVGGGSYITNFKKAIWPDYGRVKYSGQFVLNMNFPGTIDAMHLSANLGQNSPLITPTGTLESMVWDKTKPKIEQGGLFVAIAELKDVPRMLMTTAKGFHTLWTLSGLGIGRAINERQLGRHLANWRMAPKVASNHFLNHAFGWVPFVKDVSAFFRQHR